MSTQEVIAILDKRIATLQQARALIIGATPAKPKYTKSKESHMSAVGRKRISEAMKARWAAKKKAAKKAA